MPKMNCWEFKKCGREPGGSNVAELGVCPVAIESKANGIHGGTNAGRCCWTIAGTLCGGSVQGTFANKFYNCEECDFYRFVKEEQGQDFCGAGAILKRLG